MKSDKWILRDGVPVPASDLMAWAEWFESKEAQKERIVARDEKDGVVVSTVFLALDHSFGGKEPVLYETLVFNGPFDGEMYRYTNKESAIRGHKEMVAKVFGS